MAKDVQATIPVRPDYQVKRGAVKSESGLVVQKKARVIFDSAGTDSSGAANSAIGSHGTGVFLPTKAIITRVYWENVTGFTSAANTATIAITANSAGDLKAATAVSNAAYSTSGTFADGVQGGAAANFVQCSAEREIVLTVAVQALTAGRLVLWVEYAQGE